MTALVDRSHPAQGRYPVHAGVRRAGVGAGPDDEANSWPGHQRGPGQCPVSISCHSGSASAVASARRGRGAARNVGVGDVTGRLL